MQIHHCQQLIRQQQNQQEVLHAANQRIATLRESKEKLQNQLNHAKIHVSQLISEIEKQEAKAAREHKAERKAQEAGFIIVTAHNWFSQGLEVKISYWSGDHCI